MKDLIRLTKLDDSFSRPVVLISMVPNTKKDVAKCSTKIIDGTARKYFLIHILKNVDVTEFLSFDTELLDGLYLLSFVF